MKFYNEILIDNAIVRKSLTFNIRFVYDTLKENHSFLSSMDNFKNTREFS